MPHTEYWVAVDGVPITATLAPILIAMTITDADGGQSDQLEIELDDADGHIALPPTNAPIQAGMVLVGDAGDDLGPPVMFEGRVDRPTSALARGGGLTLTISAKSADVKGKPKEHRQKSREKGKLSQAAKAWGRDAGLDVSVEGGIDVERPYWAMQGESFLNWGTRMAREIGATFKVRGSKAVFAPRSGGKSAGGQALPPVYARRAFAADGTRTGNIISGQMSPVDDRQDWQKFQARFYDPKDAKWKVEDVEARSRPGSVTHLDRFSRADKDAAKGRGDANSAESERDRGGGTITIDLEPTAQAEAPCIVSGYRPGIDGTYRIKTARHRLVRTGGSTTELTLAQPAGEAGTDDRKAGGGGE